MSPEQEYKQLFERMAQLCDEQGWGDPFSYARSKEILAAISLGHKVATTFSGADAFDKQGRPLEYKSTTGEKCKGSYTGISVQPTWEQQDKYLREEKIVPYRHYYNRFKDGKLVESYEMDGEKVYKILKDKLEKSYPTALNKKDPRLSANITWGEIEANGHRVLPQMNIALKHQEGLEFLSDIPDNSVDLVLTDPPYEISRPTGFIKSQGENTIERFKMSYEFGEWDERATNLAPFVSEFYRVLRPSGTMIMFYDLWKLTNLADIMQSAKFKQLRMIEWVKTNPVPINSQLNYLTNCREIALTGVKKSKPTFHSKYDKGIYEFPIYHAKDRFHPTQKSLPLFEALITKHSNEGDLVLDCFAGSATTAVAAQNTNRSFMGCEIDEEYYNKATQRINNE